MWPFISEKGHWFYFCRPWVIIRQISLCPMIMLVVKTSWGKKWDRKAKNGSGLAYAAPGEIQTPWGPEKGLELQATWKLYLNSIRHANGGNSTKYSLPAVLSWTNSRDFPKWRSPWYQDGGSIIRYDYSYPTLASWLFSSEKGTLFHICHPSALIREIRLCPMFLVVLASRGKQWDKKAQKITKASLTLLQAKYSPLGLCWSKATWCGRSPPRLKGVALASLMLTVDRNVWKKIPHIHTLLLLLFRKSLHRSENSFFAWFF